MIVDKILYRIPAKEVDFKNMPNNEEFYFVIDLAGGKRVHRCGHIKAHPNNFSYVLLENMSNEAQPTIANPLLCEVVFTKDMFIKAIHEIEKQYNHDRKCSDAFKVLLPNDYTSNYDNHWLQNQLIEILQIAMNDNHKDSWIEYYLWELDFGRKWKKDSVKVKGKNFKLQNAYDLWDLLNLA